MECIRSSHIKSSRGIMLTPTFFLFLMLAFMTPSTAAFELTICVLPDFDGCTYYLRPGSGNCVSVPWNDALNSFKIKDGGCEFFRDYGCVYKLFGEVNGEKPVLEGDNVNSVSSFRCYY